MEWLSSTLLWSKKCCIIHLLNMTAWVQWRILNLHDLAVQKHLWDPGSLSYFLILSRSSLCSPYEHPQKCHSQCRWPKWNSHRPKLQEVVVCTYNNRHRMPLLPLHRQKHSISTDISRYSTAPPQTIGYCCVNVSNQWQPLCNVHTLPLQWPRHILLYAITTSLPSPIITFQQLNFLESHWNCCVLLS